MDNQNKKILVVEDDGLISNILSDKLKALNFIVYKADDGRKAVDIILKHKPDLILLDLLLPELDGYKVLETIRKNPDRDIAETKVVVLSNLWSDKDILSAQALRIDAYFVKANTDFSQVLDQITASLAK
jgi:CheY-like chemotaxis protein